MAKDIELTEKELKEVVGGAYVEDGYLYYTLHGKKMRSKIYSHEDEIIKLCASFTDDQVMLYSLYMNPGDWIGEEEEC